MTQVRAEPPEQHALDELFTRLRDALRAGFFPVEPHPDVCRRCDLELVCRKGPHLDLKPSTHRVPQAPGGDASQAGFKESSPPGARDGGAS
jgi:hypothetical protein